MRSKHYLFSVLSLFLLCCGHNTDSSTAALSRRTVTQHIIHEKGMTVQRRFSPPEGYVRISTDDHSFAGYLHNLALKAAGAPVHYFDGSIKEKVVHEAVIDMEIGKRDLQQCADAVMRLRGEYLYAWKAYEQISFTLTNGFQVKYSMWMQGYRVAVNGNKTSWQKTAAPSNTYQDFRQYMDFVFTYAGTLSLSRMLKPKALKDIAAGDVFILGGSPGHAVIVIDVAENKSGQKVFMLAQSYMPAQEIHILKNMEDPSLSPWYSASFSGNLHTPQWTFNDGQLMTW